VTWFLQRRLDDRGDAFRGHPGIVGIERPSRLILTPVTITALQQGASGRSPPNRRPVLAGTRRLTRCDNAGLGLARRQPRRFGGLCARVETASDRRVDAHARSHSRRACVARGKTNDQAGLNWLHRRDSSGWQRRDAGWDRRRQWRRSSESWPVDAARPLRRVQNRIMTWQGRRRLMRHCEPLGLRAIALRCRMLCG
jgi:hypothetical protein